ncbi:thermonuclease family protein [Peptoniphilus raoultii]|uniref:thermonuclease family protein n=1 Tax=Peptoniphilus raoultii TaxID=1776387 RepID=UPI0008D9B16F|nr:thermonuclease family protein [Peptoniphilus raoultii]
MKARIKYLIFIALLLGLYAFISRSNNFYEEVYCYKVIDGDTIKAKTIDGDSMKIRIIGINAPEKNKEEYAEDSCEFAKSLLEDKIIYLEKDISDKDQYGRFLRYIWLKIPKNQSYKNIRDLNYSGISLNKGYSRTYTFEPDTKYLKEFKKIEKNTRDKKLGLWAFKGEVTRGNKR